MSSKHYYGLVFHFQQYRAVINLKEKNLGTKEKNLKQGLVSAEDPSSTRVETQPAID